MNTTAPTRIVAKSTPLTPCCDCGCPTCAKGECCGGGCCDCCGAKNKS